MGFSVGAMPNEGASMSDSTVSVSNDGSDAAADAAAAAAAAVDSDAVAPDAGDNADEALGEAGLRALVAEREARKNAEAAQRDLEAKIKEFEDRDKTEQQKAEEAAARIASDLDATKASLAAAELNLARTQVAYEKGIPAELVPRLRGDTREELEADADALLEIVGKREPEAPRKPKPVGSLGTGGEARLTPAEQFAALMEGSLQM